jgi:hypothetical protein
VKKSGATNYDNLGVNSCAAVLANFRGFAGVGDLQHEPKDFVLCEIDMARKTRVDMQFYLKHVTKNVSIILDN